MNIFELIWSSLVLWVLCVTTIWIGDISGVPLWLLPVLVIGCFVIVVAAMKAGWKRLRTSNSEKPVAKSPSLPTILQNHYVLAVNDVKKSATFYMETLGFEVVAEPAGWVFVQKDRCLIMLGECPDDTPPGELGSHNYFAYLHVDDVDAYRARLEAHGVEMLNDVTDQPWGMREFGIRTWDGHRIMLGQAIAG